MNEGKLNKNGSPNAITFTHTKHFLTYWWSFYNVSKCEQMETSKRVRTDFYGNWIFWVCVSVCIVALSYSIFNLPTFNDTCGILICVMQEPNVMWDQRRKKKKPSNKDVWTEAVYVRNGKLMWNDEIKVSSMSFLLNDKFRMCSLGYILCEVHVRLWMEQHAKWNNKWHDMYWSSISAVRKRKYIKFVSWFDIKSTRSIYEWTF